MVTKSGLTSMIEVAMHCEACDHLFVFHVAQSGDMVIYGYHRMANCPEGCPRAAEHQA
jgi:hypothetical protein